jgi:hypothetical protein
VGEDANEIGEREREREREEEEEAKGENKRRKALLYTGSSLDPRSKLSEVYYGQVFSNIVLWNIYVFVAFAAQGE